ncbi:MAG: NADH-quinone oxidoreductase subunit NuoG [candidate division Zixibacteria bacterium]|nr:NADH-quinone oxidoreductase subunit NuoG [candidate division Zixibacteria bacterium]
MHITVEGKKIEFKPGQTILEAALAAGFYIPTYCWHPKLDPVGACRICFVEVEKSPKLVVSCSTPAAEGQVVWIDSEKAKKGRAGVTEFLLINHPLDCPTCDKGGECDLQDISWKNGGDVSRFEEQKYRFIVDRNSTFDDLSIGPMIVRNQNRCIHCYKCVRFNKEIAGEGDLGAFERGYHTEINSIGPEGIVNEYAGNTVEICPVGALTAKDWRYKIRVWLTQKTPSVCNQCSDGCNTTLWTSAQHLFRITSRRNDAVDEGWICNKGWYNYQLVNHPERLKKPLIKRSGKFEEVSWDEALDFAAAQLSKIRDEMGADLIGGVTSPLLSNEENYVFQRFFRQVIGTNNVDFRVRFGKNAPPSGLFKEAVRIRMEELEQAKGILILGMDSNREHPILNLRLHKAKTRNGTRLFVAHSRGVKLGEWAGGQVVYKVGSEIAFLNSILAALLGDKVLKEIPKEATALGKKLAEWSPESAKEQTGVGASQIKEWAKSWAAAGELTILLGREIVFHPQREEIVKTCRLLSYLLNGPELTARKVNLLFEEGNTQGTADVGCLPDVLPGYRKVGDPTGDFNEKWGDVSLPDKPGRDVFGMLSAARERKLSALVVMGQDILFSFPDYHFAREALEAVGFIVVIDQFMTQTAKLAQVVIPSSAFVEKEGTYTNWERRVQRFGRAYRPLGEARPGWQIIADLADRMGRPFSLHSPQGVFDELAHMIPSYSGISYADLAGEGKVWEGNGNKPAVYEIFSPKEIVPEKNFPILLATGNSLQHSGILHFPTENQQRMEPEPYLEVNADELLKMKKYKGDRVKVTSALGEMEVRVRPSELMPPGVVFLPENFPSAQVNKLMKWDKPYLWVRLENA